eukprot:11776810-Alexandrium_andersonii.AAC.1
MTPERLQRVAQGAASNCPLPPRAVVEERSAVRACCLLREVGPLSGSARRTALGLRILTVRSQTRTEGVHLGVR